MQFSEDEFLNSFIPENNNEYTTREEVLAWLKKLQREGQLSAVERNVLEHKMVYNTQEQRQEPPPGYHVPEALLALHRSEEEQRREEAWRRIEEMLLSFNQINVSPAVSDLMTDLRQLNR